MQNGERTEENISNIADRFDRWMVHDKNPRGIDDGGFLIEWYGDTPGVEKSIDTYSRFCQLASYLHKNKGYNIPSIPSQTDFETGATVKILAETFDCWLTEINIHPKEIVASRDGGAILLGWLNEDFGVKGKVKTYQRFTDMIDFLEQQMDYKFGSRPSEDLFYAVPGMVRPKPASPLTLEEAIEVREENAHDLMAAASIPAASQEVLSPRKRGRRPRINPVLADLPPEAPVEGIARAFDDWRKSAATFLSWIVQEDGVESQINTYSRFKLTAQFLIEKMGYKFPIPSESEYKSAMEARANRTAHIYQKMEHGECVL